MEHLPVHLPYEAALGGPVQFRWMYLYERQMHHLKQKAKNKAKNAGSIVAQYITEEISHFSSYYFAADGRGTHHHQMTQGEIQFAYDYPDVPSMFQPIGRVSGRSILTLPLTKPLRSENHLVDQLPNATSIRSVS